MKTYVFCGLFEEVGRVQANNMEEAIAKFKRTYIGKTYAWVHSL
jgi:hypothetical protein